MCCTVYCHQLFVIQCHCWLSNLTKGPWHSFVERTRLHIYSCNDSRDSVMHNHTTRTSITVVSKFPRKTWGTTHARTVDTRRSSPIFSSTRNKATLHSKIYSWPHPCRHLDDEPAWGQWCWRGQACVPGEDHPVAAHGLQSHHLTTPGLSTTMQCTTTIITGEFPVL